MIRYTIDDSFHRMKLTTHDALNREWTDSYGTDSQDVYVNFVTPEIYCIFPDGVKVSTEDMFGDGKISTNRMSDMISIAMYVLDKYDPEFKAGSRYADDNGIARSMLGKYFDDPFPDDVNENTSGGENSFTGGISTGIKGLTVYMNSPDSDDAEILMNEFDRELDGHRSKWSRVDRGWSYDHMPCAAKAAYLYGTWDNPLGMITYGITRDRLVTVYRYMAPSWAPADAPAVQERTCDYPFMDGLNPANHAEAMHSWARYMAAGTADIMESEIARYSIPPEKRMNDEHEPLPGSAQTHRPSSH